MDKLTYWLDAQDLIQGVDAGWHHAVKDHEAPECHAAQVIGQPLWVFVQGEAVRQSLRAIFFSVRTYQCPVMLPWRCDTPDKRRLYQMTVSPLEAGAISIEHKRIPMPQIAAPPPCVHPQPGWLRCSVCCEPVSPWSRVVPAYRDETETVCRSCRQAITRTLDTLAGIDSGASQAHMPLQALPPQSRHPSRRSARK